ncbi:MAG: SAM-dependent DNA methyltransferase [Alphaproteobacteria bacterium]|nr:SAM-dependent DNA methyltransferase [Alphaproteobacteria bacterium]
MSPQIKHRNRVVAHGEVFTSSREVNAMLDLVEHEAHRVDSRFLEPACGTGNFLCPVLERKLATVANRYRKSQVEYERYSIIALSSIYGVDILFDNVEECRERLFEVFSENYARHFGSSIKEAVLQIARVILETNILWGDALSMRRADGSEEPIVFTEWTAVNGRKIKRREYKLAHLMSGHPGDDHGLFSDLGEAAFLPKPVREYPLIDFMEIADQC